MYYIHVHQSHPFLIKKNNDSKDGIEQVDNSDKDNNNTSDTVSHHTQLPDIQPPINEDNLNLGTFPRVIRNRINSDILPIYGKNISIDWLNDYQIRVLYNGGITTYGDSVALKRIDGKYAKYQSFKYQHYIEQRVEWQIKNYNWLNITYNKEEFMHSNIGYSTHKFCHLYGKLYKTFKKEENDATNK